MRVDRTGLRALCTQQALENPLFPYRLFSTEEARPISQTFIHTTYRAKTHTPAAFVSQCYVMQWGHIVTLNSLSQNTFTIRKKQGYFPCSSKARLLALHSPALTSHSFTCSLSKRARQTGRPGRAGHFPALWHGFQTYAVFKSQTGGNLLVSFSDFSAGSWG
jgi:hypothetical protein